MENFIIRGGRPLRGSVRVSGAKNAALPILAATLLTREPCVLRECPDILDLRRALELLEALGAKVTRTGNVLTIDPGGVQSARVDGEAAGRMRASVLFLGALLGRLGTAAVAAPGGCAIGRRPIDLHLSALKALGADVAEGNGMIFCRAACLRGAPIVFPFPSVGATENALLAAVRAEGVTRIENAAREPEIVDLADFLNQMGGRIQGAGSPQIRVEGVPVLHGAPHTVIPDRIEAATYLTGAAITGGAVRVLGARADHLEAVLEFFRRTGCRVEAEPGGIFLQAPARLRPACLTTGPYPAFPTDVQPQAMALLTLAEGTSTINETVFEARFRQAPELSAMGARIRVDGPLAAVTGVSSLAGACVTARELRGGAALVLAAMAARGESRVSGVPCLDRGYEDLEGKLRALGADIKRMQE